MPKGTAPTSMGMVSRMPSRNSRDADILIPGSKTYSETDVAADQRAQCRRLYRFGQIVEPVQTDPRDQFVTTVGTDDHAGQIGIDLLPQPVHEFKSGVAIIQMVVGQHQLGHEPAV